MPWRIVIILNLDQFRSVLIFLLSCSDHKPGCLKQSSLIISQFSRSELGQTWLSRLLRFSQAKDKVCQLGWDLIWSLWRRIHFQVHSGILQNSISVAIGLRYLFPCYKLKVILSSKIHARFFSHGPFIFKDSNGALNHPHPSNLMSSAIKWRTLFSECSPDWVKSSQIISIYCRQLTWDTNYICKIPS